MTLTPTVKEYFAALERLKQNKPERGKRPAKTHSNAVSRAERVACITGCTLTLYHTLHA